MAFDVVVYPKNAGEESAGIVFDGVDKISLVSDATYGKPPLLPGVEDKDGNITAAISETILYIATGGVACFEVRSSGR